MAECFEGHFEVNKKLFARVYDTEAKTSKFKTVDKKFKAFIPDQNGTFEFPTNPKFKLKEKVFNNFSGLKKEITPFKEMGVPYGVLSPQLVDIYENYWDKTPVPDSRIWYLDIEVIDLENRKFPSPHLAEAPVTHIQILDSFSKNVIILTTKKPSENVFAKFPYVKIITLETENKLFEAFIKLLKKHNPTIITAWNGENFDFPYLTNRAKILGISIHKFSPLGKSTLDISMKDNKHIYSTRWEGLYLLDMLQTYKKFTYGDQKSYSLEYTAHLILGKGKGKVDYGEYKSIFNFFEKNYDMFFEYAIQDVIILEKIDKKLGLNNLIIMMSHMMGCNFYDIFGTVKPWTSFLSLIAYKNNEILPPEPKGSLGKAIQGGFVAEPSIGLHNWEISIDYNSLYPSIMVAFNISADTYVNYADLPEEAKEIYEIFREEDETILLKDKSLQEKIEKVCKENSLVFAGMGFYRKEKIGLIPDIVAKIYKDRKNEKTKMLIAEALKNRLKDFE